MHQHDRKTGDWIEALPLVILGTGLMAIGIKGLGEIVAREIRAYKAKEK